MFCNHFFQKLKGLLVKAGLSLSLECLHAVIKKISLAWHEDAYSFKQGFDSFLKTYINALLRQRLIPYIDLSWACDPSLRAFDML